MRQLLDIDDLNRQQIIALLDSATVFADNGITALNAPYTVASLFYENSTRTTASFELAAKRLGLTYLPLQLASSSEAKGETLFDTTDTLLAMEVSAFVIRHKSEQLIFDLAQQFGASCSFINAGSGMAAHPTQALLDLLTLSQLGIPFEQLKIALVGDLHHSRVVKSVIKGLTLMGTTDIRCIAPKPFQLNEALGCIHSEALSSTLEGVDAVMTFRLQKERFESNSHLNLESYVEDFQINELLLSRACPKAKVMHPGPINREVEISSEVADGPRSLIRQQVKNGVLMRAAILKWIQQI